MNDNEPEVDLLSENFQNLSEVLEIFNHNNVLKKKHLIPSQNIVKDSLNQTLSNLKNSEIKPLFLNISQPDSKNLETNNILKNKNQNSNSPEYLSPQVSPTRKKGSIFFKNFMNSVSMQNFNFNNLAKKDKTNTNSKTTENPSLVYHLVSKFYLIKKFISNLRFSTSRNSIKYINKICFDFINDKAFFYHKNQANSKQTKSIIIRKNKTAFLENMEFYYRNIIKFINKKIPIFDINHNYVIAWNFLAMLAMLYLFFYIPALIAFENFIEKYENMKLLKMISLFILIIDCIKNFNTSFYKEGHLIIEHSAIACNYVKNNFLRDLISLIPLLLALFLDTDHNPNDFYYIINFSMYLFFLKLSQFQEIFKKFEEMIFINDFMHNILALIKLIFRIILVSHIFACFWYMIGSTNVYSDKNWINYYNLSNESPLTKYLYSYYFVCITINTVGYGDISPQNPLEILFTIGFIYFACGMFAYSLNCISNIINDLTNLEKEFSKDMSLINSFMHENNINLDLRLRIRKYLEYIFYEEKLEKNQKQVQIINKLSDMLKEELLLEANGPLIRDIKFFSLNFSEESLRRTVSIMKVARYTPGEIIFSSKDIYNKDLYVVSKGAIQLSIENEINSNQVVIAKECKRGDLFGEMSFFSNKERSYTAKSMNFSTVYIIKQEEFINILKKNQKDYEKFCEMRDSINLNQDIRALFGRCKACKQNTHRIEKCPNIHYKPFHDIIIQKHLFNPFQPREKFARNLNRKKTNSRNFLNYVIKKSMELQNELEMNLNEEIFRHYEETQTQHEASEEIDENSLISSNYAQNYNKEVKSLFTIKDEEEKQEEPHLESNKSTEDIFLKDKKQFISQKKTVMPFNSHEKNKSKLYRTIDSNKFTDDNEVIKNEDSESKAYINSEEDIPSLEFKRDSSSSIISPSLPMRSTHLRTCTVLVNDQIKNNRSRYKDAISLTATYSENGTSKNITYGYAKKTNENLRESIEIDQVFSFKRYFVRNNIESIIERNENLRLKNISKRIKKSNLQNVANLIVENIREKSKCSEITTSFKRKQGLGLLRRNFFKNSKNLEKLKDDENFDPKKLREFYEKKYGKKKKIHFAERIKSFFSKITGKKTKNKIKKEIKSKASNIKD